MKTLLRIIIIIAILLALVFLSIGIVRYVPKALSSLASATVSLGSVFGGDKENASSTASSTSEVGGFIVTSSSTPSTNTSPQSTSTKNTNGSGAALFGKNYYNSYIPKPAGTNNSGVHTGTTYTNTTCVAGGSPDMAVVILSRGILNSYGQYIETNSFTTNDTVAVKFKVENRGTCPTGPWNLKVQMPAQNSADQVRDIAGNSLPAGAAITGQANFTSPKIGNSSIVLTATETSATDANNSDNTTTSAISVIAGTNNQTPTGNYPTSGDGRPDLRVSVVSVGILDYNNNFIPVNNQNFRVGSRIAVKFQVVNQGNNPTGPWSFKAQVNDTYQTRIYQSPQNENSLPAGGASAYTVSFDNLGAGVHTMNLTADTYNQVNEYDESNNSFGVNFTINY